MKKKNISVCSRGFTLVEIIVVLAVAATLAAIVAPNIMSRITTQKQKTATEQCMQAVSAAQQLLLDHTTYDVSEFGPDSETSLEAVEKLSGVEGTVKYIEIVNNELVHLCYVRGGDAVMYCRYYNDVTGGGSHNHSFNIDCDDYEHPHDELYTFVMDGEGFYSDVSGVQWDGTTTSGGGSSSPSDWEEKTTETTTSSSSGSDDDDDSETTTASASSSDGAPSYTADQEYSMLDTVLNTILPQYITNYSNWGATTLSVDINLSSNYTRSYQNGNWYTIYPGESTDTYTTYYLVSMNYTNIQVEQGVYSGYSLKEYLDAIGKVDTSDEDAVAAAAQELYTALTTAEEGTTGWNMLNAIQNAIDSDIASDDDVVIFKIANDTSVGIDSDVIEKGYADGSSVVYKRGDPDTAVAPQLGDVYYNKSGDYYEVYASMQATGWFPISNDYGLVS